MKRHLFVCQDESIIARGESAFHEVQQCTLQQARSQAYRGDLVWILVEQDGWADLITRLAKRGVVLVTLAYCPDATQALLALDAGARAYVPATAPPAMFSQVALVASNQGLWIWPELLQQMVGSACRLRHGEAPANDALSRLTGRERDVALAVAAGKSNKEVANELGIAERTVKAHLGAVFRKLGLRDRMQLMLALSSKAAAKELS